MGRRGPKKKSGKRHKCGKLVKQTPQEKQEAAVEVGVNYAKLAAQQPHRRGIELPANLSDRQRAKIGDPGTNPRAATEFGRMALEGLISEAQYVAGEKYARVVGKWRAMIGGPRAIAGIGRGYDCKADCRHTYPPDPCECRDRQQAHDAAFKALGPAGAAAHAAVDCVVLCNQTLSGDALTIVDLRAGLSALAKHFESESEREVKYAERVG